MLSLPRVSPLWRPVWRRGWIWLGSLALSNCLGIPVCGGLVCTMRLKAYWPPSHHLWNCDSWRSRGPGIGGKQGFPQLGSESVWQTSSFKGRVPSWALCPTSWSLSSPQLTSRTCAILNSPAPHVWAWRAWPPNQAQAGLGSSTLQSARQPVLSEAGTREGWIGGGALGKQR